MFVNLKVSVSGLVNVDVSVSGENIARVDLYVDDSLIEFDTQSPYNFTWDSEGIESSTICVSAQAINEAGVVGQSEAIWLTVDNRKPNIPPHIEEPEIPPVVEPEQPAPAPTVPEPIITLIKKLIELLEKFFK